MASQSKFNLAKFLTSALHFFDHAFLGLPRFHSPQIHRSITCISVSRSAAMINFGNRPRRGRAKDSKNGGISGFGNRQSSQVSEDIQDESPCKNLLELLAQTPIAEKPHNLSGFPVKVVEIEGRGRGLVVERDVRAGEILLCAARMGSAIRVKQDCLWCHECLQHRLEDWSPPLPVACSECEAVWCCQGGAKS